MESRKIVKSGNTSYILALPIDWIRKNRLESGKLVQVYENEHEDLIISAEKKKVVPTENIITIKVDGKDEDTINLEFMKAYIQDAHSIIFEGNEIVQKNSKIQESIRNFIGLDMIEQSTKNIVAKNFFILDRETSPSFLLKKMDIVNRANFELLQAFFHKGFGNEDFSELQKLNEQNERLFILAQKSILKLLEYPSLMRNIQTNHLQTVKEKIFVHSLMNISISLLLLGKAFLFLARTRPEIKDIQEIFLDNYKEYCNLVSAISSKSLEDISLFLKKYHSKTENLEKLLKSLDDPLLIQAIASFSGIYQNMKDMAKESLI